MDSGRDDIAPDNGSERGEDTMSKTNDMILGRLLLHYEVAEIDAGPDGLKVRRVLIESPLKISLEPGSSLSCQDSETHCGYL